MTGATGDPPAQPGPYEIRLIGSRSPHFLLLECWGIRDRSRHEYLRVPGSSHRIRRFYSLASAQTYLLGLLIHS
ncbi:hypothetical protein [Streptomyces sp. CB01881]|uniref:hypothetical protein n=1 Tax=Streptomyces sp. CB01881 TaxID=2078691 RepID=UPI000CDC2403|nr:hypothetical protein [Streptomyces sp. CB01881]AUY53251.1 hypothetical protein C2142_34985 [Streptomyces sp. CB01881]TYC69409.1 hypothetical protein EH183_35055 [Streptomyces sp. CB01881]